MLALDFCIIQTPLKENKEKVYNFHGAEFFLNFLVEVKISSCQAYFVGPAQDSANSRLKILRNEKPSHLQKFGPERAW